MAVLTDAFATQVISHFLRNTTQTPAATLYLALFTTAPSEDGTGGVEVTGGAYARQAIAFDAPSAGATQNSAQISFPVATANWGTVVGAGVFTASSGGTLLFYNALAGGSQVVNSGAQFVIAAGNADFSLE